ncbi:MAG: drug/metabolite transporter, family [Pseudonocardiales bacterium]|nr:drug/metabolite transporter, family [Pseudonocardiales bacterium]
MFTRTSSGLFALVLAGVLWGTGGLTGRLFADNTGLAPVAVAGYRLSLGGILLVVLLAARGNGPPRTTAAWQRIIAVATLAAGFQATYFSAVALTGVSLATLITIGSAPVCVLVFQSVHTGRRPYGRSAAVVAMGLLGLTLLIGLPAAGTDPLHETLGAGLALLSGVLFAAFTLLGGGGLLAISGATAGIAFTPNLTGFGLLALLATAPTALAYTLFLRGLRTVPSATATVVALLEPLTGTVLSVIVLGERLSPAGVIGAVVLGAAIVTSTRTNGASAAAAPIE